MSNDLGIEPFNSRRSTAEVLIGGIEPVLPQFSQFSSKRYHALYKEYFKSSGTGVEITEMESWKGKIWSRIQRRMYSNEAAIKLGIHCSSVWTVAQLRTWTRFEKRKWAACRWGQRSGFRMKPEESDLVRSGWDFMKVRWFELFRRSL